MEDHAVTWHCTYILWLVVLKIDINSHIQKSHKMEEMCQKMSCATNMAYMYIIQSIHAHDSQRDTHPEKHKA